MYVCIRLHICSTPSNLIRVASFLYSSVPQPLVGWGLLEDQALQNMESAIHCPAASAFRHWVNQACFTNRIWNQPVNGLWPIPDMVPALWQYSRRIQQEWTIIIITGTNSTIINRIPYKPNQWTPDDSQRVHGQNIVSIISKSTKMYTIVQNNKCNLKKKTSLVKF